MASITISTTINAPIANVFNSYLNPQDNLRWNTAGYGWTNDYAKIDAIAGGEFHIGYKSPDEKNDFDFNGKYIEIVKDKLIKSELGDGRKVEVNFEAEDEKTHVTIIFDAEEENSLDLQKQGWSAILENFKKFVERKSNPKNASITKNIVIQATKEKVWKMLLEDKPYRQWTSSFTEGSYYEGEMKYDGKIMFLSPSGTGISSKIVVFIPNFQISFEHLGGVKDGIEDFKSSEFEGWKYARETYTLNGVDGKVNLQIYVEVTKNEEQMMSDLWDKALAELKKMCEE